ncbi:MAG TPA: Xaa-Pro peptidase family protein [Chloroflexota bacterium]|nr:Xaa-Pro peptidase family protein [Chloroflexota bacterium]
MSGLAPEVRTAIQARLTRAQASLRQCGWDLLWLGASTNLRYLTGVNEKPSERLFGAAIPASGAPLLVVPLLYEREMAELSAIEDVRAWADELGAEGAARLIPVPDGATVALDPLLLARFGFLLREVFPGRSFVSAEALLAELRLRKDEQEKAALRRAAAMADAVIAEVTSRPLVGRTERAVAAEVEHLYRQQGSEGVSFAPIVSAGANAASPHHLPDGTIIQPGDSVVIDCGGVSGGYASDITRTVFAGEPAPEMRRVYQVVQAAQEQACTRVSLGMAAGTADSIARAAIEAAGYGPYFVHRLGHGIGLDVHEAPYLVSGSSVPLETGVAFSVEPGVYLPGVGGVRIEDIVLMNDSGPERINHAPREPRVTG